ncbi:hypothetical protein GCM10008983_20300 [Lentibacillus halophilus]|uniref:Uncharacterized protein n=1 Tax=Lentibacillus halophilus TaxID=295065 RepID=A0ABN0ZC79_9BACI
MEIILVILAIIGAISGLFKDRSESSDPIPKQNDRTQETAPKTMNDTDTDTNTDNDSQSTVSPVSIEEMQQQQREDLEKRMNHAETVNEDTEQRHDANLSHHPRQPANDTSVERQRLKKRMVTNLNRNGLVNGVVMSEVLGQPRALKPYRSIIAQRKK